MSSKDLRRARRVARGAAIACVALTLGLSGLAAAASSEWRVSGGGILSNGDQFGGTAAETSGRWTHLVAATGRRLLGTVELTTCAVSGTDSNCTVQGRGTFNGQAVIFSLRLSDRGEAGQPDTYAIGIGPVSGGALYRFSGTTADGNLQLQSRIGCEHGVC
jgi:hypothetical protein